jgi:hypothetical protein
MWGQFLAIASRRKRNLRKHPVERVEELSDGDKHKKSENDILDTFVMRSQSRSEIMETFQEAQLPAGQPIGNCGK